MSLLYLIGVPLAVTIAVEEFLSFIMGKRGVYRVLTVAAVNMATNPALNFILYVLGLFMTGSPSGPVVLALETAVVLIEWRIFAVVFPEEKKGSLVYSLILNAGSYLTGLIIFGNT